MRYFTICPERGCEEHDAGTIIQEHIGTQKETPSGGRYMTLFLDPTVTYVLIKDTEIKEEQAFIVCSIKEYMDEGLPRRKYYRVGTQRKEEDGTSVLTISQFPGIRYRVIETTDRNDIHVEE